MNMELISASTTYHFRCPCGAINQIKIDLLGEDIEAIECWSCKQMYFTDEEMASIHDGPACEFSLATEKGTEVDVS
jgi:hypothetical protein